MIKDYDLSEDDKAPKSMTAEAISDLRMIAGLGPISARHVVDAIRKGQVRHLKFKPNRRKTKKCDGPI